MKNMKKVASLGVAATLVAGGLVVTPAFAAAAKTPAEWANCAGTQQAKATTILTADQLVALCGAKPKAAHKHPVKVENGQLSSSDAKESDAIANVDKLLQDALLVPQAKDGLKASGWKEAKSDPKMEEKAKFAEQGVAPAQGKASKDKKAAKPKGKKADNKKGHKADNKKGNLAKTGVATGALAGLAGLLGAAGVAAVRRSRRA